MTMSVISSSTRTEVGVCFVPFAMSEVQTSDSAALAECTPNGSLTEVEGSKYRFETIEGTRCAGYRRRP